MMEQLKHQLSDKRASGPVKLTLDVENTVTKRNGKLHLDPFEPDNTLFMVGMLEAKHLHAIGDTRQRCKLSGRLIRLITLEEEIVEVLRGSVFEHERDRFEFSYCF